MKISSIHFTEIPSGESVLRCPQCGATWHLNGGSGLTPCNCIRFLWSSSELGEANLGSPADFDRTDFEDAYRRQHWSVCQDDDIIDGDLGSPDPYVLEKLFFSGVDEAHRATIMTATLGAQYAHRQWRKFP